MTEENKTQNTNHLVEQVTTFIEKQGIATFLLIAVAYVAYTSFLEPAGRRYVAMLDAVTQSNVSLTETISELKKGMVEIGIKNTEVGTKNAESLSDIEDHLKQIEVLSREIKLKLDSSLIRSPYSPPPPTPPETSSDAL